MRSHLVSIWPQRVTNEEKVMIATQAPWGLGYNPEIRASHPIYPGETVVSSSTAKRDEPCPENS